MTKIDKFKYNLKIHLKNNLGVYFFLGFLMIVGIVFGFVLAFSDNSYIDLLSSSDKTLFDYINGSAEISSIFFSRLLYSLLFMLIIFLTNISIYTSFISVFLIGYQCLLFVLSCAAVISLYGISGVINCLFLIIPINVLNLIVMAFFCGVCNSRALIAKRFKMGYSASCEYINFSFYMWFSISLMLIICIIHSFVIPAFLKSLIIVSF